MANLSLYLLGSLHLALDGQPLTIQRRKVLALLCYLAVSGERHRREHLAALFWPESDHRRAHGSLRRTMSSLNRALGGDWLESDREAVRLHPEAEVWLDVAQFRHLLADCDATNPACLEALTEAVILYRDNFLSGFTLPDCPDFDEWQFFQAESLRRQFAGALTKLVQIRQAQGDHEGAIPPARRWLALDPLNEPAHRALMLAYAHTDQPTAALRQYQLCQQTLADELGIAPAVETTALYERIRKGELNRETKIESRISPSSPPEGKISSPPIGGPVGAKPRTTRHNLPAQTTPFIGRKRTLAELTRLLTDPDTRLVTILGPGGIGKTRLARQVGRRLLEQFADGVWFLSLAAVDADALGPALNPLLHALAAVFDLRLQGRNWPLEQISAYLQGRKMLLIFDNLEHVLDSSEIISQLLRDVAGITVLVTSRERLNLKEEWLFPLEGLALPDSVAPQAQAAEAEAIQLFTQVAQRVQSEFDLSSHLMAVAQICRLVEGMPLGIELAASWVRYMAPAEIAQDIEKDIDFLATTVRNLPSRHRSLRGVFDHSWRLLSPQEQEVLPQLAVFRGGFRPAEAQAVTGAARLILTGLVDKSLVSVSAEGRYDLHELLRQYLLEKLSEDLTAYQAAHDRHSQVYLASLQLDPAELNRQTTLQRLTADYDNIRAAWHWAIDHAHWSAIRRSRQGLHIFCRNKSWFLEENAYYERTISGLLQHQMAQPGVPPEAAIEIATETETTLLLAALHGDHSEVQRRLVTHDPIHKTRLDESLDILRALGPTAYPELADLLSKAAANSLRRNVDHKAHLRYGQEALTLCQSLGNRYGQLLALQGVGAAALFAGQFASAAAYADQLSALAEAVDNPYGRFAALEMRGNITQAQGDYPQAEDYSGQAYHLAASIDPAFPALPFVLTDLANIARLQGDYAQATAYLQQTATTEHPVEHRHRDGFRPNRHHKVLLASGNLAEAQGDLPAAQQLFTEIWQQDQGHSYYSPAALIGLGRIVLQQADWAAARRHFAAALPLIVQLETAPQALEALAGVAHLQAQAGQPEQALTLINLVYHHSSSYQETKDRLAGLEAELRATLSPEQVQAALARGQAGELWATLAAVRVDLDT